MTNDDSKALVIHRRTFLTASGALLVSLAAPFEWAQVEAIGGTTRPPVAFDQLDSYITIDPDGTVVAYYGRIDGGQGLETAIAQMVAEEIDVPFERVRVVMGSSTVLDMGGASASLSVAESVAGMRQVIARLSVVEHGRFWTWNGREHAW